MGTHMVLASGEWTHHVPGATTGRGHEGARLLVDRGGEGALAAWAGRWVPCGREGHTVWEGAPLCLLSDHVHRRAHVQEPRALLGDVGWGPGVGQRNSGLNA